MMHKFQKVIEVTVTAKVSYEEVRDFVEQLGDSVDICDLYDKKANDLYDENPDKYDILSRGFFVGESNWYNKV